MHLPEARKLESTLEKLLITNARLINEGEIRDADVLVTGQRIEKIGWEYRRKKMLRCLMRMAST